MTLPHRPLETVEIFTPLGIRFWDPALNRIINDGLYVTARPADGGGPVREAFRTASGIFAFQNLPGLRHIERPDLLRPPDPALPVSRDFLVEVSDHIGRYLPMLFNVRAPVQGVYLNGLFRPGPASLPALLSPPAAALPGFYLFSAPNRGLLPGLGVIRACLVDHASGDPAAYAVLEAQVGGQRWYSFADSRGCVVLLFPPPPVQTAPVVGSEPARFAHPPHENRWPVTLRARYQPSALAVPQGARLPELRSIFSQDAAGLLPAEGAPPQEEWDTELYFAQELIVRTGDLPSLLIEPGD